MEKTVLIIDDCDMMRRFLEPIFKNDFRVKGMNNPFEAIIWLKANPIPDLIILDYDLPEMTGLDLLQYLRNNETWADVPVIILSGVKEAEKRWECLSVGANDFLSKPFLPKELLLRANLVLNKKLATN